MPTLCDAAKQNRPLVRGCHYRAEQVLLRISQGWTPGVGLPAHPEDHEYEYTPEALYARIGSSPERAREASEYLK